MRDIKHIKINGVKKPLEGKSAYELAIESGIFSGTLEEWLASLKGEKGEKGADGKDAEITNLAQTLDGNEEDKAPSVKAVNEGLAGKISKSSLAQTFGDGEDVAISQKTVTEAFDDILNKEATGEYNEEVVASLTVNDFSLRTETPKGDTALIEVVQGRKYKFSFDNCPYDGNGGGLCSLYLTEYKEDLTKIVADSAISFQRLGTGLGFSAHLVSSMFPNGGEAEITVGANTKYISIMFDAFLGAPERLPEGITLAYLYPVTAYGDIKAEKIPENSIGFEHLKNMRVVSNNLFNKKTATTGESVYLGKSSTGTPLYGWYCSGAVDHVGTSVSSSGYDSTSTAIEVDGGQTYCVSHATIKNFFDENDCWINHASYPMSSGSFVAPSDAKYMRISFSSTQKNQLQLVKGDVLLPYDEWKMGIDDFATDKSALMEELLLRHSLQSTRVQKHMWEIAEEAHKYTAHDRHTFIFVSDTHATTISNRVMSTVASMTKYVPCSYVAHGGDIVDGISPKENELLLLSTLARNANDARCPVYYVKGNHDWNLLYVDTKGASADQYILNSELSRRTNQFVQNNIVGNLEKMYFFVEDEVTKIRTIFINEFNKDESGEKTDLANNVQVYGQEQLEWFANEALDFSDKADRAEWGVIVIGHQMIDSRIASILVNFKNGTKQNVSVTENSGTFTVAVDFTEQGAMDVIAVFVGDNHYDDLVPLSSTHGIAGILILNASLANDYADGHHPSSKSALLPPDKEFGTENETAFDIVTVDRENHLIYLTRYGARSYVYNDETGAYDKIAARTRVVNYSTSEYSILTE